MKGETEAIVHECGSMISASIDSLALDKFDGLPTLCL